MHSTLRSQIFIPMLVASAMVASPIALADLKIDQAGLAQLQKIAVVGNSFWRDVEMDTSGGMFAPQKVKELKPKDPEYQMMQGAASRVMTLLQKGGSFTALPPEEVFAHADYLQLTKDPKSKWAANWFYPDQYRVISLKAKNAKALCAALGVDAVVQFEFDSSSSGSGFSLGVYKNTKVISSLSGVITMIDKDGKTLISGKVKSDEVLKSTTHAFGAVDSVGSSGGVAIANQVDAPIGDDRYELMLQDYLGKLSAELGFE